MKKLLVAITAIMLLALTSCSTAPVEVEEPPPSLSEGFGIYGSKATLDGLYPGWTGTVSITIINGGDRDRTFRISAVQPRKIAEGYEAIPVNYLSWFTVDPTTVYADKGVNTEIPITVSMPKDADCKGKSMEVRILVEDITQTGLVQLAMESRWFVSTAE